MAFFRLSRSARLAALLLLLGFSRLGRAAPEPGLLFSLSGDQGTVAEYSAGGTATPNVVSDVTIIPDGAVGVGLSCAHTQVLSYWAPGNIYAQRGTLAFFWRAREAVGPTEFPIFRVAYADHSSWDMVWLRIDYNGHGFDAFVTDINLARTRVSYAMPQFPAPNQWVHLALTWDETSGIRFYVDGRLVAEKRVMAVYDAALDQFGPHSRIISPHQVQSDYNFVRGGDIDEVRIYDHGLNDEAIATLAKGQALTHPEAALIRSLADAATREEWDLRYGWTQAMGPPPALPSPHTVIRKVEIHEAYDLKRWWWKANDGIRETTWPGVYNRSRLPGRNDYFQLPDWDCYSLSGKSITFTLPDEPWNHLEIAGSAWGRISFLPTSVGRGKAEPSRSAFTTLFRRPARQLVTVHALPSAYRGGNLRFENVEQEEPIGELAAYFVQAGSAPEGRPTLTYTLGIAIPAAGDLTDHQPDEVLESFFAWIAQRFAPDERQVLVAQPAGPREERPKIVPGAAPLMPLVHVLVPHKFAGTSAYDFTLMEAGLDGIALDLPALEVSPTHGDLVAMNIQVKDPLWPLRNLLDFTFSMKPGEPVSLWLDLRDRILPADKNIYLTIACSSADFRAASLSGTQLRLIFKPRELARVEHEIDRFTQARDSYAMLVEEHPHDARFNLWNRFEGDLRDLLRVNPQHRPGLNYAVAAGVSGFTKPPFTQPEPPPGVPLWAFLQVKVLEQAKKFVLWYIDHRQIENGEFGGGISDDTDLLNLWPGVALMGAEPEKIRDSVHRLLEAAYANGMFTHGLSTIQTDELHSYEEGINCLGENLLLDFGSPRQLERAMETARSIIGITGVNTAGHRHIRSSYYSGTRLAEDSVWGYSKGYSYLVLQPGLLLVDYNGAPPFRQTVLELADGLLAHGKRDAEKRYSLPKAIHFATDAEVDSGRTYLPWHLFWAAYLWTNQENYLEPIRTNDAALAAVSADVRNVLKLGADWDARIMKAPEAGSPIEGRARGDVRHRKNRPRDNRETASQHFAWQATGDKMYLEKLYAEQLEQIALLDYINTEGSLWTDRVSVPTADLQRARLGGVALIRNSLYPGHTVSWNFEAPATEQSLAILLPLATPTEFKILAYNLEPVPVTAAITGWQVEPGQWEVTQGIDSTGKDTPDRDVSVRTLAFERSHSVSFTFPPGTTTVLLFRRTLPGTPYHARPDLGLGRDDVTVQKNRVRVTVHSLGAVASPEASIIIKDHLGRVLSRAVVPPLPAPADLLPKTAVVELPLREGAELAGATVELDPQHSLEEITVLNNAILL